CARIAHGLCEHRERERPLRGLARLCETNPAIELSALYTTPVTDVSPPCRLHGGRCASTWRDPDEERGGGGARGGIRHLCDGVQKAALDFCIQRRIERPLSHQRQELLADSSLSGEQLRDSRVQRSALRIERRKKGDRSGAQ